MKRTVKAWMLVDRKGSPFIKFKSISGMSDHVEMSMAHQKRKLFHRGYEIKPCTITYDDGKKARRKGK